MSSALKARVFVGTLVGLGLAGLFLSFGQGMSIGSPRYLVYLTAAIVFSFLSFRGRSLQGPVTVNVIFIVLGLIELNYVETLTLGCTPALLQCLYNPRIRSQPVHIIVTLGSLAAAISSAGFAYRALLPASVDIMFVRLMLATGVFFVMNTFPAAAAMGLAEGRRFSQVWRENHLWSLPYYLVGASMAGILHLTAAGPTSSEITLLVIPVIYLIYRSYHTQALAAEQQKKHVEQVTELYHRSIEGLALAVEARDSDTRLHLVRVQTYALEVAQAMDLSPQDIEALRVGAILHDVGKMAVPDYILSKPGRLTQEEFSKVKTHSVVGAGILVEMGFPGEVVEIVRHHHERWDGSGYPSGLAGEAIPIGARILAAADSLDALSSDREYRRAYPLERAMQMVIDQAGRTYDPRVVDVLARCYRTAAGKARERCETGALSRSPLGPAMREARPSAGFEMSASACREEEIGGLASAAAAQRESRALLELSQELLSSMNLSDIPPLVAARVRSLIAFDCMAVFLPKPDGVLEAAYVAGDGSVYLWSMRCPAGEGLVGWVSQERKSILNGNPSVEPGLNAEAQEAMADWSVIGAPIEGVGDSAGVMAIYRRTRDAFSTDELRVLRRVTSVAALALENALRFSEVESQARTDELTSLPNTRGLFEHLDRQIAHCRETDTPLGLLICDLNDFKKVNDVFGHLAGNELLRDVAGKLRTAVRQGDCVARLGGDEFVVVMPEADAAAAAMQVNRLARAVAQASEARDYPPVSMSVGVAVYPDDGPDGLALLAAADRRMYSAKSGARSLITADAGESAAGNTVPANPPLQFAAKQ